MLPVSQKHPLCPGGPAFLSRNGAVRLSGAHHLGPLRTPPGMTRQSQPGMIFPAPAYRRRLLAQALPTLQTTL